MWDVLGFGVVAVDELVYVDVYPGPDSKAPIRDMRREGGGLAGTALVAAARQGARTAYGGYLGEDELSLFTIAGLEREGVDCSALKRKPDARPHHSIIIVDQSNGQRTILYGGAGVLLPQIDDFAGIIAQCRVLMVDSSVPEFGKAATALAHQRGIQVVVDLERQPLPEVCALGAQVDHLITGSVWAEKATGETDPAAMVRALRTPAHKACVVTVGAEGCWCASDETGAEVRHFPAPRVQAVDTTGCGDVFHGAYAAGLARGEGIAQSIIDATATAALKATRPGGGRAGIPTRDVVERFLRERPPQTW